MRLDFRNSSVTSPDALLCVVGLLFPFFILRMIDTFHYDDVRIFAQWADCWKADASNIYNLCPSANYPYIGMVFSAALISRLKDFFDLIDVDGVATYFRVVLAFFDALNFVMLALIARTLQIQHPIKVALIIEMLPSSWAGGALWGQIDAISQLFLLISLYCLLRAFQSAPDSEAKSVSYFFVSLLAIVACLLTKQLAIFSIFALAPLVIAVLVQFRSASKLARLLAVGSILSAAGAFLILDRHLAIRGFLGSSYLYVWLGGGSHHSQIIAGNGFNIWVLLNRYMGAPSSEPFFCSALFGRDLCLTPFFTGLAFFGAYTLVACVLCCQLARRTLMSCGGAQSNLFLIGCILFIAMINLGFNVFLTGTHERYLYHFYPFLLVSAFALTSGKADSSPAMIGAYIGAAVLYGLFVLSIIETPPSWLLSILQPQFLAAVHFGLLLSLVALAFSLTEQASCARRLSTPRAAITS